MNSRYKTLLALALLVPFSTHAQLGLAITVAPPPMPYYAQPPVPGEDYIWTPGYWAWSTADSDYYWVPGTWVLAPNAGDLWTPGYWGFVGSAFFWHAGYWGPTVGFYGGLNYGYGYNGSGYQGGRWNHGHFVYNPHMQGRSRGASPVSYNGSHGGSSAKPPPQELHPQLTERHAPSEIQMQHEQAAVSRPLQRATGVHAQPLVAATPRPLAFEAPGVEHARPAPPPQLIKRPAPTPPIRRQAQPERPRQGAAEPEASPHRER